MSLHIDVRDVTDVLLADGDWYDVQPGTFRLDAYEYADTTVEEYANATHELPLWNGGSHGSTATGFEFIVRGQGFRIAGPFSAILATRRAVQEGGDR